MIQVTDKSKCCGCNACGDVCPKNAISFKTDIEGFWYPEVDSNLCVDCGLCNKVCPIEHSIELKTNDLQQSVCYAAEHKNLEVVFDSTSGGLFSALAEVVYKGGGSVGGAVFNDDFSVRHFISNDKADLVRLRSSKYLQSDCSGFYRSVKERLQAGEQVLVCGTPCQMAALRRFLKKDYDNLIIADFICRGINSPKVWHKYLESFQERYGSSVVSAKAKSKEYGWHNLTQKVILANGKAYYETGSVSNFTKGYLRTNAYCRPSCYDCQFKGFPRIADITLADFWGIEKIDKSLDRDLGTSLVMVNSQKGLDFFERVKPKIKCVQVPFEKAVVGNPALIKPLNPPLVDRRQFFEDLEKMSFLQLAKKYITLQPRSVKNQGKAFLKQTLSFLKYGYSIFTFSQCHFRPLWQLWRFNSLTNIWKRRILQFSPCCVVEIAKNAQLKIDGILKLGTKRLKKSKLETRLLVESEGLLQVHGSVYFGYGSDVEVFKGGKLILHDGFGTNINCTIICQELIDIGKNVKIGRNVTIRDNNGNHYLNRQGYKNTRPVIIGEKVWLCEGCTIMPGVHIGDGAIIGAHAFVTSNVPANALVSGNPARIVDEDVLWKY